MDYRHKPRETSAKIFILKGLIPYTEANVMLAFKPSLFFRELEKISRYKKRTMEKAMREAERQNLIQIKVERDERIVELTDLGKKIIRPYVANKLESNAQLMIIFDIPEDIRWARLRLRRVIQSWDFEQVQKSVWVTSFDHRQSIKELVAELEINDYVQMYECAPI